MLLMMFVNAVWCEVYLLAASYEAEQAYETCLSTASDVEGRFACYLDLLGAVGNASIEFFSCMY